MKKRICKLPERPKTYDEWYARVGYKYPLNKRQAVNFNQKAIRERDNYECQKCGLSQLKAESVSLETNHILPTSYNSGSESENLITLCHPCHKTAPNPENFFKYCKTGLPQRYDFAVAIAKATVLIMITNKTDTIPKTSEVCLMFRRTWEIVKDKWELVDKPMIHHYLNRSSSDATKEISDVPKDIAKGIAKFSKKYQLDRESDYTTLYELIQLLAYAPYSNMFSSTKDWQKCRTD